MNNNNNNNNVVFLFSQPPIFPDITSLSRSEQLALLGFGSALLGSCCSACVARLHLASLGLGHSALLSSASLGSRRSARSACVASLSLASWLAARITGSRHSACVGLRQLWLALLGSRREPSVTRLRVTCIAGWLASSLACFAGVAGSLAGACFSSHHSALCSALRHFAWPRVAGSRCWLAARVAGSRRSACVSVSSPRIAWLALLCSCSFQ